jgi:hypothetical protein
VADNNNFFIYIKLPISLGIEIFSDTAKTAGWSGAEGWTGEGAAPGQHTC